jgi:L-2,4-diaminobutyric acid acetyltransferase
VEASVTPDNSASQALFRGFAHRRDAPLTTAELIGSELLGREHPPEILLRIGPIDRPAGRRPACPPHRRGQ